LRLQRYNTFRLTQAFLIKKSHFF